MCRLCFPKGNWKGSCAQDTIVFPEHLAKGGWGKAALAEMQPSLHTRIGNPSVSRGGEVIGEKLPKIIVFSPVEIRPCGCCFLHYNFVLQMQNDKHK